MVIPFLNTRNIQLGGLASVSTRLLLLAEHFTRLNNLVRVKSTWIHPNCRKGVLETVSRAW